MLKLESIVYYIHSIKVKKNLFQISFKVKAEITAWPFEAQFYD